MEIYTSINDKTIYLIILIEFIVIQNPQKQYMFFIMRNYIKNILYSDKTLVELLIQQIVLSYNARQWQMWWLRTKIVAKLMSYVLQLLACENSENLRIV